MKHLISDLLRCDDMLTAGKVLKEIDAHLDDSPSKRASFCKVLAEHITHTVLFSMDAFTSPAKTYTLYPPDFSIHPYLIASGLATGKVRHTRERIKRLIADIDANAAAPSGRILAYNRAAAILNTVGGLFPYYSIVSRERLLVILNLNNSDRRYNSICGISDTSSGSTILLLHMKDDEADPDSVLLHEMGHALHNAICGAGVPEEFYRFQSIFTVPLERGDPMAAEVFADCFAIAALHSSSLKEVMPFEVDRTIADIITRFMENFIRRWSVKV